MNEYNGSNWKWKDQTDLKWNWNLIEIEWNYLDQVGTEWNYLDQNGIRWNYLDKIVYLESENIRV